MNKTAIFVEGQTELIFMREYLLKMLEYQDIWIECYTLFTDGNFNSTEYSFPNENADHYFQIINVGNDNAVITRLLRRERYLWDSGFHKIYAIRDMYSSDYKEIAKNHQIHADINAKFIEGANKTIAEKATHPNNINFHFAIMEAEAWILGLEGCFIHLDARLTHDFISKQLEIDIATKDPETTYFHPAKIMADIYEIVGKQYNKSKSDINAVMSFINKNDFIKLSESGKCLSFKAVHHSLIPN